LGGKPHSRIGRLNTDGTIDASFNPEADGTVYALAVQPDGKILVGGSFGRMNGQMRYLIARLNQDGSLDNTFNPGNSGNYWKVNALVIQADGKIVVGGSFERMAGVTNNYIARLNPDGTNDADFSPATDGYTAVNALALQADGKILVGMGGSGTLYMNSIVYRLNTDGSRDLGFLVTVKGAAHNTYVYALLVQADDKIVVGGDFTTLAGEARADIGRLNANGSLDSGNPDSNFSVRTLAQQKDGKIVVGGEFSTMGGVTRKYISRLETDFSLDATFDPAAGSTVYALLVQPDGKIVVGGNFTSMGGAAHYYIARLKPDGTLDASFP
jgi:uncharacterized delta-60 repeat protein